jgi:four helix bundle protein
MIEAYAAAPTRIEISHLGDSISGGYIWPIANANARAQGSAGSRESLSALLNTAEGNGRRQGRQRAKSFDDARGSAIECAACLDASVAKGFAVLERIQTGKEMLVRIVAMLTKLVERFDPDQYRVRENASGVAQSFEDEDDDEHEHE